MIFKGPENKYVILFKHKIYYKETRHKLNARLIIERYFRHDVKSNKLL